MKKIKRSKKQKKEGMIDDAQKDVFQEDCFDVKHTVILVDDHLIT